MTIKQRSYKLFFKVTPLINIIYITYKYWHPTPVLLPGKSHGRRSLVGCSPWGRWELDMTEWFHFHALEKEMATHSSVLAWRIPGTGEPGGLPSIKSHRFGHDWSDLAAAAAALNKWRVCNSCEKVWELERWPHKQTFKGRFSSSTQLHFVYVETKQVPVGFLGTKAFLWPPFLDYKK